MKNSLLKYGVVGVLGTVTHLGLLYVFVEWFGMPPLPATSVAFIWVVLQSYMLSHSWVFESDNSVATSLPRFIVVSLAGFFGNLGIMYLLISVLGMWYMGAQMVTILIIPPMNYLMNRHWTFS